MREYTSYPQFHKLRDEKRLREKHKNLSVKMRLLILRRFQCKSIHGITHSLRIWEVGIEFPLPKSVGNDIPVLFIKIAIYVVMGIVLSQGMHFYVLMGKTIPTRVRTFM